MNVSGVLTAQEDRAKAAYDNSPCEMCHGASGEGDVGPALVPLTYEATEFAGIVRSGIGHMPAISRADISDADLQLVFAYLKRSTDDATARLKADPAAAREPGLADLRARIGDARRAGDVYALAAAAHDARTLAAQADAAAALSGFEAIVQAPAPQSPARLTEARDLLRGVADFLQLPPGDSRRVFVDGVDAALAPADPGALDAADALLRRAAEQLPAKAAPGAWPAWTQADAWAWLGRVLAARKDIVGARRAYTRALELEPNFLWVTKTLLPALR